MTSSAIDKVYGRRGGRWADKDAGHLIEQLKAARDPERLPVDLERRSHPDVIAADRAHQRRRPGSCATDRTTTAGRCDCQPDPDELADIWAGRAHMAQARQDADVPLDQTDREALNRAGPLSQPAAPAVDRPRSDGARRRRSNNA